MSVVGLVRIWVLSPPTPSHPCMPVLFLPTPVCLFSSWLANWLLCPCLGWHMSHDSGLSPFGLICCYGMSPVRLTQCPLVTGIVNLYTVMGLPASSGWTAVPQGSSVLACWLAPTPWHCLFNVARQWTVISWPHLLLRHESIVIDI